MSCVSMRELKPQVLQLCFVTALDLFVLVFRLATIGVLLSLTITARGTTVSGASARAPPKRATRTTCVLCVHLALPD